MNGPRDRLWQTAHVVEDEAGDRWLEFDDPTRCARCKQGRGCGAAQWGRLFGRRSTQRLPLEFDVSWPVGGRVRAGVEARTLLRMALHAYGFPLLAFVLAILIVDRLGASELIALLAALAATVGALYWARRTAFSGIRPVIEAWDEDCEPLETLER